MAIEEDEREAESCSVEASNEGCAQFDNNHLQVMACEVLQYACLTCNEDCWQDGNACCPILKFFVDAQKKNKGKGIGGLDSCWSLLEFSDTYLSCAVANHSLKYSLHLEALNEYVELELFIWKLKEFNLGDNNLLRPWEEFATILRGGTCTEFATIFRGGTAQCFI